MISPDALRLIKTFLRPAHLAPSTTALLVRLLAAFLGHRGRLSASQAASAVASEACHRAQWVRFLARCRWSQDGAVRTAVADLLLRQEARRAGTWAFLLDQT